MRSHIGFAAFVAVCGAVAVSAQTPAAQRQTFDFSNKPTPQNLQEMATVLRTVGDIRQLSADPAASTITVNGTADELAMSGWILRQLDQPASSSALQYPVAGKSDDVIRLFHLANLPTAPQVMQEVLTTLRTVADVQKVFNYTPLQDLIMRGPAAQMALAEYLIRALDVAPGSTATNPEFQYQAATGGQVARVFYLATVKVPQQIQEILTVLRTVVDIQKVFYLTPNSAIAIRCSPGDLATAAWIIQSLDIPANQIPLASAGPREFIMPAAASPLGGIVVRVFYPTHIAIPKGIQETLTMLRTKLSIQRVFNYSALPALVVRGTADQITKAEQLISAQDQLAKATP